MMQRIKDKVLLFLLLISTLSIANIALAADEQNHPRSNIYVIFEPASPKQHPSIVVPVFINEHLIYALGKYEYLVYPCTGKKIRIASISWTGAYSELFLTPIIGEDYYVKIHRKYEPAIGETYVNNIIEVIGKDEGIKMLKDYKQVDYSFD